MPRLNLSVTKQAEMRINNLLNDESLEFNTKADVFRTALTLLELATEEVKRGNRISVTKNNKVIKEIVLGI